MAIPSGLSGCCFRPTVFEPLVTKSICAHPAFYSTGCLRLSTQRMHLDLLSWQVDWGSDNAGRT